MSSAKWRPFCLGFNVLTKQDNTNTVKHVPYTILNTYLQIGWLLFLKWSTIVAIIKFLFIPEWISNDMPSKVQNEIT